MVPVRELVDEFKRGDLAQAAGLRVTIAKIRSRLAKAAPGHASVVHTIRGIGYRVSAENVGGGLGQQTQPNFPET